MWRRVFKLVVSLLAAIGLTVVCAGLGICLAYLSVTSAHAATATVGADVWRVSDGPAPRYRPDYATANPWREQSLFAVGSLSHQLDIDVPVTIHAAGQYSQVNGHRIDRLEADLPVSDALGVRVGQVSYRTSWSRAYSASNPWIAEPDAFVRFAGLSEINQGAPGVQVYRSAFAGEWVVDALAGLYRPMMWGPDNALGPYAGVGPNVKHHKSGLSVNALNLATGLQLRASWLKSLQDQADTTGSAKSYERRLRWDTYFFGVEGSATAQVDWRATLGAYIGDQTNPANAYAFNGRSLTLEGIYKPMRGRTVAVGLSRYTNATQYASSLNLQFLQVPSFSVAYRFDMQDGWFCVLEATRSHDDYTRTTGANTFRTGNAMGLRVGKTF